MIGNASGATKNATVSGGNIKIGTATAYGQLDISCALFNMSAEYDPKINGPNNGQSDKLIFTAGSLNILGGSTIKVTILGGQPPKGNSYTVISGSETPLSSFTNSNLSGLALNTAQLQNKVYELDQP